jgi:hypothetical protein
MLLVLAGLATAGAGFAQTSPQPTSAAAAVQPARAPQGIAVLASGATRDEAFGLARAVYASSLRPRALDELRARILGGDPAPAGGTKEIRELAELRGSIIGEDAASRRLLQSIASQLGVEALLVVSRAPARTESEVQGDAGIPLEAGPAVSLEAGAPLSMEAGAPVASPTTGAPVIARLFLADAGDFDAARYEADPPPAGGWLATVTSLARRFPPPPTSAPAAVQLRTPPPKLPSEGHDAKPFYMSPWLWGALGAAALIGGFFYFSAQDTGDDPIHVQMRVPR